MEEQLVVVCRQPRDHRFATVRLSDINGICWSDTSGGTHTYTRNYFLYGYMYCDKIVNGEISHSCIHGPCPHYIKVYITKNANSEIFSDLAINAGEKPGTSTRPRGMPPCTKQILNLLQNECSVKRKELREELLSLGYQSNTIRSALKTMQNDKKILLNGFGVNQLIWRNNS